MSYALRERGFSVYVMPLERIQWLNVLRSPPPRGFPPRLQMQAQQP